MLIASAEGMHGTMMPLLGSDYRKTRSMSQEKRVQAGNEPAQGHLSSYEAVGKNLNLIDELYQAGEKAALTT